MYGCFQGGPVVSRQLGVHYAANLFGRIWMWLRWCPCVGAWLCAGVAVVMPVDVRSDGRIEAGAAGECLCRCPRCGVTRSLLIIEDWS